jgi:hypothetical protein
MTKDLNEDLIEATIRRVAEAKAARAANADRLAESEAPVAAPESAPQRGKDGSTSSGAGVSAESQASRQTSPPARADDDRIAETIRRVAEAKAARAAEAHRMTPPVAAEAAPAAADQREAPAVRPTPIRGEDRQAPPQGADTAVLLELVAQLRQDLAATRNDMRELAVRFEAARDDRNDGRPVAETGEDDWDDAPQMARLPLGQPRPAILRDPSPRPATAEHLEPEPETIIDTRPLPKPLPPLHAEPKRGLDLLPRTYRVTVEDKRRGVDLVTLHRALLGMDGVRDMSLLSYSNGVAIVALEMVDELDPQSLESAVTRAMSRGAKVEVHNDTTMVVKLAEE